MGQAGHDAVTPLEAAREYVRRGWRVVPIPFKQKRPVLKEWEQLRLTEPQLKQYFDQPANLGLILGEPSGHLVDVDLDCVEARAFASNYLPATPAKTGRNDATDSHWWYIATDAKTAQHRDPVTKQMLVELRSTGGQTVVGPSIHPTGQPYEILTGEPAVVPAEMLTACVAALAKRVIELRHGNFDPVAASGNGRTKAVARTGSHPDRITQQQSSSDIESRALAYLDKLPPAISGNGGHAATYTAATVLVHGFEIDPERALALLLDHYNLRCEPPWTEQELRHKVTSAATKPHDQPRGWLLNQEREPPVDASVDISALVSQAEGTAPKVRATERELPTDSADDPGPIPTELLRVPGFISEVMDFSLATAPYPNQPLAFCGALALQAFLGGRKVRDQADNRTNLYLLSLAHSAAGKDWPRKVNARILHAIDQANALGEHFASGEGLQDALYLTSCMLFQTDEIDGLLQSINKAKDARYEGILGTLLTMYSAAASVFPMRRKAGKERGETIEQPCLVIYGTAIPTHYYSALSERMLTNGFFARMLIVEAGKRGEGQEPKIVDLPPRILETATYWANFTPGKGNMEKFFPIPHIVRYTDEAQSLLIESRQACEREYSLAEERGDAVGTTVWGRTNEHIRKLALLYSISANHREPSIDVLAAAWATQFATHQTRRMLFMAQSHVADNPFHAECLKLLKKLRDAGGRMGRNKLMRTMHLKMADFNQIISTLLSQGDINTVDIPTKTKPAFGYQLASEIRHEEG
ncbi:MAG: bifunctional DNA primase/polymerase [Planctomycetaceae bacterium]|nr:bifunctional DNA primase/polymerase [Planctomycetaceae bacterium]